VWVLVPVCGGDRRVVVLYSRDHVALVPGPPAGCTGCEDGEGCESGVVLVTKVIEDKKD
jgi:hypothetical protein